MNAETTTAKETVGSMTPKEAWDKMEENPNSTLLIDVRSSMEFLFVGHAVNSIHLPWIDEPDWQINPQFSEGVRQLQTASEKQSPDSEINILLICRSGKRSLEAGNHLIEDGFHNVFNIEGGFEGERNEENQRSTINGWRFDGLPWEQC